MSKGNFKVKCIKDCKSITTDNLAWKKGKFYKFVNGKCRREDGILSENHEDFTQLMRTNNHYLGHLVLAGDNQTIVIYTKGNETIATLKQGKEILKTSKAICSPTDEFDFEFGAKLAFQRLMGEEVGGEKEPNQDTINWEDFKNGKFVVNCKTEELAKEFIKECDEQGIEWNSGDKASSLFYCDSGYYERDYEIIEYKPSTPQMREVKRVAEVGEWIKVVNCEAASGLGQTYKENDIFKVSNNHACCIGDVGVNGIPSFIDETEYVVLENYQPEEPKEPKEDNTINVGDMVKVVDNGKSYNLYKRWFDEFAPRYSRRFAFGKLVKNGLKGKVVAKHKHKSSSDALYAIQINSSSYNEVYLMNERGIKKVK